jgi:hypothetical protein
MSGQGGPVGLRGRAWHTYGIGSSYDSAAGLQGGDDAGLGDGDALLLHGLMDTGSVLVIHLRESRGPFFSVTLAPLPQ